MWIVSHFSQALGGTSGSSGIGKTFLPDSHSLTLNLIVSVHSASPY